MIFVSIFLAKQQLGTLFSSVSSDLHLLIEAGDIWAAQR